MEGKGGLTRHLIVVKLCLHVTLIDSRSFSYLFNKRTYLRNRQNIEIETVNEHTLGA